MLLLLMQAFLQLESTPGQCNRDYPGSESLRGRHLPWILWPYTKCLSNSAQRCSRNQSRKCSLYRTQLLALVWNPTQGLALPPIQCPAQPPTQFPALPPTRERALSLTQFPTLAPTQNLPQAQARRVAQRKRHHGIRGPASTGTQPRMLLRLF